MGYEYKLRTIIKDDTYEFSNRYEADRCLEIISRPTRKIYRLANQQLYPSTINLTGRNPQTIHEK